jgi:PTS system ascorbate-specific IIC component
MSVLNFVATQIFGQPAILFGLIALLGLILQKKSFSDTLLGTVKTIIGFYVLIGGVNLLLAAINPVVSWIQAAIGVTGVQPQEFLVMGVVMEKYAGQVGLALLIGFAINILLARFTRHKYIAITGHLMLHWSAWIVGMVAATSLPTIAVVLLSGLICGVQYWASPAIIAYFMKKSGKMTDEYSVYCHEVTGIAFASTFGKFIGNPDKRCEDIKVPKGMEWINDNTVSMAVISGIVWLVVAIIAGPDVVATTSGGQFWLFYVILLAMQFAGGLTVLLIGVRMLIAELVPAFNGIAEALVPGAIPGLDYPTVFGFAQPAVLVGFIFNLLGAVAATLFLIAFDAPVIVLPAVWINFWQGGILGVFADVFGGRRAVVVTTFLAGFISAIGWGLIYPLQGIASQCGAVYNYTDSATYGALLAWLINLIN